MTDLPFNEICQATRPQPRLPSPRGGKGPLIATLCPMARAARAAGKPVAAIDLGRTRADAEFALKLERPCGETLAALVRRLVG